MLENKKNRNIDTKETMVKDQFLEFGNYDLMHFKLLKVPYHKANL